MEMMNSWKEYSSQPFELTIYDMLQQAEDN